MRYTFGDIVVLPFSYTDLLSSKRRPALVVLDSGDGDIVVARITSKPYDTAYDFAIRDWSVAGLMVPSFVRIHKLMTVEGTHVLRRVGQLGPEDMVVARMNFRSLIE